MADTPMTDAVRLADRDGITAAWLTEALRHGGAVTASSVVAAQCAPVGTGQVADTFRYELTYDRVEPDAPAAVIAKVSAADEGSRAAAIAFRLYEREVNFYRSLASRAGIRTPRCYYGDIDPTSGRFVLILEDLSPAAIVDQLGGLAADQMSLALEQAAALHAAMWADSSLEGLEWLAFGRSQAPAVSEVTAPLASTFIERYCDKLDATCVDLVQQLSGRASSYWAGQGGPLTVVHNDYRPDNMLFAAKGGAIPLAVVDWQTIGLGPSLTDVAFLAGTSMETAERREHEAALVREYHDRLTSTVEGFGWEECWRAYRYQALYAIYFLVPAAALVDRTERGDRMFLTMISRAATQIVDLRSAELLN
ncbi:MAG TPA: phosphotransferase [Galbitalea sp.]|nr:phosphotransferase [Galbitalea sp.]